MNTKFHLALPCKDVKDTREFYTDIFGVNVGRSSDQWVDIDLYGHQITFANTGEFDFKYKNYRFEEYILPAFHFGIIIDREQWHELFSRLSALDLEITTEATFLENQPGEHLSFFIQDPNGYMVEFKSFKESADTFRN